MSVPSRSRSLSEISRKIVKGSRIVEQTLTRLAANGRPLSVLEVGFGWGRALTELAWMFRDEPIDFHGVDIDCRPPVERSEDLRQIARRFGTVPEASLASFRVPQLHFYDASRLHFDDESLDLIYSAVAIRFFERKAEFIEEACRVLRPGGVALLQLGEKNWDYPYGPVGEPPTLTPYRARLLLRHRDYLVPVPEYFRLFQEDRFRFTFTPNKRRCSLLIEKLTPGRLCLNLAFNADLSGPIADIPSWTEDDGGADDGYRSVYDIRREISHGNMEDALAAHSTNR